MKYKKIHFVGIKGVGMAPLAIIAKEAGAKVSGSDVGDVYITDEILKKVGIIPRIGFDPTRVEGADLVIATGAHGGLLNPEVIAAKEKGITVLLQGPAVGEYMNGEIFGREQYGISVAGCHGKTTTTAMIATLLDAAEMDPSYIIGTGIVPSLGSAGHFGKGKYFVAEADEYATEPNSLRASDKNANPSIDEIGSVPKLLWQYPQIGVITNIEFDHPDMYATLDEVRHAYEQFAQQVAQDGGLLVVNGDDPQIQQLLETYDGEVITFGLEKENDYVISAKESGKFALTVEQERWHGEFRIGLPGLHNIKNATAAVVVARELKIDSKTIQKGLSLFTGTKRRLEYKGTLGSGAILYDDYAHHPTEIVTTLHALKEQYPNKKIALIFQPHTFSRTKLLFEEFIDSIGLADKAFLIDIFPSAREPLDTTISSKDIADKLKEKKENIFYLPKLIDMVQYVKQNQDQFGNDIVLVTMGAGDVYQIADDLLKK